MPPSLDPDDAGDLPPDAPLPDVDAASLSSYAHRDETTHLRRAFDLLAAPAGSPAPARGGAPSSSARRGTLAVAAITPASLAAFATTAGWTPPPTWCGDAVWEVDDDGDGCVTWRELLVAAARARGPSAAAEPRALVDVAAFAAAADPVTWRLSGDAATAAAHLRSGRGAAMTAALADLAPASADAPMDLDTALASAPASLTLEGYVAAAARSQARALRSLPGVGAWRRRAGGGGGGRRRARRDWKSGKAGSKRGDRKVER